MPGINSGPEWLKADNKEEIFKRIRHERMVEFAAEGLNFSDMKRWGVLEELNNKQETGFTGVVYYTRKVSERDYGVEYNTNSGLNLEDGLQKNKAESDNKKDGSNLGKSDIAGENITAGDGCYDENISDGTKKDILNSGLENSIESGEDRVVSNNDGEKDNYAANSENGIEKEKAGDNTGTVEQRFNEGGTDKVIRCPSLYDVLIDMGRTAKYSEIIEYIKKVKRSEGEEQKKLHCLDVLTKMCKNGGKKRGRVYSISSSGKYKL